MRFGSSPELKSDPLMCSVHVLHAGAVTVAVNQTCAAEMHNTLSLIRDGPIPRHAKSARQFNSSAQLLVAGSQMNMMSAL